MTKKAPRILITRLSHIGDCVLTMPMLSAIRDHFPNAWIAWAVEPPSIQLVQEHPDLDETIMIPKNWLGRRSTWSSVRRSVGHLRFDIAIDPQGITKSAMVGWLSGAKKRIGAKGRWGRELSPWLNNVRIPTQHTHLVDRSIELLRAIGIHDPNIVFRFTPDADSMNRMQQFVRQLNLDRQPLVINPGASWRSKRWIPSRFADVAKYVFEQHGIRSIVSWAGPPELEMAESIVGRADTASILAPNTSLNELAALMSLCTFYLGCDTGPMHIATAVGTPCIGLYGPNRPEESGAYGLDNIHVQRWYQDGTCRQRRSADNLAMQDITVQEVCLVCDQMIDTIHKRKAAAA